MDKKSLIKLTDFGHIGLFIEHHQNTSRLDKIFENHSETKPLKILNLFAYTGFLSLYMARKKAQVVHLDASKRVLIGLKKTLSFLALSQTIFVGLQMM